MFVVEFRLTQEMEVRKGKMHFRIFFSFLSSFFGSLLDAFRPTGQPESNVRRERGDKKEGDRALKHAQP